MACLLVLITRGVEASARAFLSGQIAHPAAQIEEENEKKKKGKNKKICIGK